MTEAPVKARYPEEEKRPGGLAGALLRFGGALADFVYPRLCCGCGERVMEPRRLVCPPCEAGLTDLALPLCPTCGLPDARGGAPTCDDCPRGLISFTAARGTTPFTGLARTLVEKLKYDGRVEYADMMAGRMALIAAEQFCGVPFDAILPVPLHKVRHRDRGFNQSEEMARRLSRHLAVPLNTKLLLRVRQTRSQTTLRRRERAENIREAFACPHPAAVAGKHLLLVDDVYTTGATLNECARTLSEAGAVSIHCLAYARAVLA